MKKLNGFLTSSAWAKIRADIYAVRGGKCELCGNMGTQVHHLTYKRYGGDEEPEDLLLLCGTCHLVQHGLIKVKKCKRRSSPTPATNPKTIARQKKKARKKTAAIEAKKLVDNHAKIKSMPLRVIIRKKIANNLA